MSDTDFLKYWRPIREYHQRRYNLTTAELETLLFLYSERFFTRKQFHEYDSLVGLSKKRFERLLYNGWIILFRQASEKARERELYELSHRARMMIMNLYNHINGLDIPTDGQLSPFTRRNATKSDKAYRKYIAKMNRDLKQQQRRSRG